MGEGDNFSCFLCVVDVVCTLFYCVHCCVWFCGWFLFFMVECDLPQVAVFCVFSCYDFVAVVCDGYFCIGECGSAVCIT